LADLRKEYWVAVEAKEEQERKQAAKGEKS